MIGVQVWVFEYWCKKALILLLFVVICLNHSLLLYLHFLKLWDESCLVWCTGLGFDSHFVFVTFIFVVTVYFFKFFYLSDNKIKKKSYLIARTLSSDKQSPQTNWLRKALISSI